MMVAVMVMGTVIANDDATTMVMHENHGVMVMVMEMVMMMVAVMVMVIIEYNL